MSKFPEKATTSDDAHTQITCYHRSLWPKTKSVTQVPSYNSDPPSFYKQLGIQLTNTRHPNRWINSLPTLFQHSGLEVLDHVTQAPLPIYRKPWNEDCLIGWAAIGDMIQSQQDRDWYRERLAEAAENAKNGWYVDWELVVCVGKSPV